MRLSRILRQIAFAAALVTGPLLPAHAQGTEMSVMTGGPTGTYIQFGRDMAGLMQQCGQTLNVVESAGSLENFLGVRQRPSTQFGIVQNDVLEYMQTFAADDPAVARAITGVRIAFPLYEEEVHILARNDIADFQGLAGKRVAIGVENSGTFLTASLMLSLSGVEPAETVQISPADALPELKAGNIDAFFYVAGAPAAIYTEGQIDGAQFHLLPIADPTLSAVYTPATIPAGTYDFQSQAVELLAVKAVLMTYEYNPRQNAYHRAACNGVSDLSSLILTRLDDLRENGHPKWKDVDLSDIPPGWDIASCVNRGISPDYQANCTAPATPAAAIESEANEAYRRSICAALGC
ncbi:MAG: TAXI family TRAP transporter solute-binding subunit [Paracoccus sp. (in: a-proteobacteria)]|uniref:TAXI family TRAP transporter solute-binding subunit n=1 Tax=Paracoccus sp. TaxID=267 RepID=UPI0026E075E6|nr:TAXI family TRAP transporter solute-binding subunit [Paracoccus sp. (in: a-proteobacteria)]MDO5613285.1 TAXI family TRAP transporter solute-binding subunit [Paracoccus sp. (in: a-proteobacteria)]